MDKYQKTFSVLLIIISLFFSVVIQAPNYQVNNISHSRVTTEVISFDKGQLYLSTHSYLQFNQNQSVFVILEINSNISDLNSSFSEISYYVNKIELNITKVDKQNAFSKWQYNGSLELQLDDIVSIIEVGIEISVVGEVIDIVSEYFQIQIPNKAKLSAIFAILFLIIVLLSSYRYWKLFDEGMHSDISFNNPIRNNIITLIIFIFTSNFAIVGSQLDDQASISTLFDIWKLLLIHSTIVLVFAFFAPVQMEKLFYRAMEMINVPKSQLIKYSTKNWSSTEKRTMIFAIFNFVIRGLDWGYMLGLMFLYSSFRALELQGDYENFKKKMFIKKMRALKRKSKK